MLDVIAETASIAKMKTEYMNAMVTGYSMLTHSRFQKAKGTNHLVL